MPTFTSMQTRNEGFIVRALNGSVFIAASAIAVPTAFSSTTTADPVALITGYKDVGYINEENGLSWSRDTSASEVRSWGSGPPTRRDITSDQTGLQFSMQETKKTVLELYHGQDLSGVTPDATTGEITFNRPTAPQPRYFRLIAITADGAGTDAVYIARVLPRATVTEVGEQAWTVEGALEYQVTVSAFTDPVLGYAYREVLFGPGIKASNTTRWTNG